MIKLDLIPSWVYWVTIGTLLVGLGAQEIRASSLKADVAEISGKLDQERADWADETTKRTAAALDHVKNIAALQAKHATDQQLKEDSHAAKIRTLEDARRADAVTAGRLRSTIATFTARDHRAGETDAAAADRYANRLGVVGGLLTEGVDLVTEGRAVIGQRDAEVARLLGQIQIDRAACTAGAPKP